MLFRYLHNFVFVLKIIKITNLKINCSCLCLQGLVVSIVCCFIHKEVRIEILVCAWRLVQRVKCLSYFSCTQHSDYFNTIRFRSSDMTPTLGTNTVFENGGKGIMKNGGANKTLLQVSAKEKKTASCVQEKAKVTIKQPRGERRRSLGSILLYCCLSESQQNDFYQLNSRRNTRQNRMKSAKKSASKSASKSVAVRSMLANNGVGGDGQRSNSRAIFDAVEASENSVSTMDEATVNSLDNSIRFEYNSKRVSLTKSIMIARV